MARRRRRRRRAALLPGVIVAEIVVVVVVVVGVVLLLVVAAAAAAASAAGGGGAGTTKTTPTTTRAPRFGARRGRTTTTTNGPSDGFGFGFIVGGGGGSGSESAVRSAFVVSVGGRDGGGGGRRRRRRRGGAAVIRRPDRPIVIAGDPSPSFGRRGGAAAAGVGGGGGGPDRVRARRRSDDDDDDRRRRRRRDPPSPGKSAAAHPSSVGALRRGASGAEAEVVARRRSVAPFRPGDLVKINGDGADGGSVAESSPSLLGVVEEKRGGGWYAVRILSRTAGEEGRTVGGDDGAGRGEAVVVKRRASQLTLAGGSGGFAGEAAAAAAAADGGFYGRGGGDVGDDRFDGNGVAKGRNDGAAAAAASARSRSKTNGSGVRVVVDDLDAEIESLRRRAGARGRGDGDGGDDDGIFGSDESARGRDDDALKRRVRQARHHSSYSKWIVFSDLHCRPSALPASLDVLSTVRDAARKRNAGVLFLGDFWHHRTTVRVDCLNAVLDALKSWEGIPTVMIPGNHDMVTLGGTEHALTPLENAFRVEEEEEVDSPTDAVHATTMATARASHPGPLIFSVPTLFNNALFVPFVRNETILSSILSSPEARSSEALFVHADVRGARTNDLYRSDADLRPSDFPSGKRVYSGHYHKPHEVTSGDAKVQYVGSPYQVSLSEAGQCKSLLVLDASRKWECAERIPIDVGRRHFRVGSTAELMELCGRGTTVKDDSDDSDDGPSVSESKEERDGSSTSDRDRRSPRKGDRVVISIVPKFDEGSSSDGGGRSPLDAKVEELRKGGVSVEVREIAPRPTGFDFDGSTDDGSDPGEARPTIPTEEEEAEDLSPLATLASYFECEIRRGTMLDGTAASLLEVGSTLLDELNSTESSTSRLGRPVGGATTGVGGASSTTAELDLESVTVEGYGPFREMTTYPLRGRGLVLIRGANDEGGGGPGGDGADSNGSGKSTLAMSALWALTGSSDPRPTQDARVSDVVNDFSKFARVEVRGEINSVPFVVVRTKSTSRRGGGSLTFVLDGKDLTRQSAKDTQLVVDETLGVDSRTLGRTIFHGQHAVNGLLESTDAKLKEELSLVVPLDLWREAAAAARVKSREAAGEASELGGMISVREGDLEEEERRLGAAEAEVIKRRNALSAKEAEVRERTTGGPSSTSSVTGGGDDDGGETILDEIQLRLDEATAAVATSERRVERSSAERDEAIASPAEEVRRASRRADAARDDLAASLRDLDRAEAEAAAAADRLDRTRRRWNLADSSSAASSTTTTSLSTAPEVCPTCRRPVVVDGADDGAETGRRLRAALEEEVAAASRAAEEASTEVDSLRRATDELRRVDAAASAERDSASDRLRSVEAERTRRTSDLRRSLVEARAVRSVASADLARAVRRVRRDAERRAAEAEAEAELSSLRDAVDAALAARDSIRSRAEGAKRALRDLEARRADARRRSGLLSDLADALGPRGVQTHVLRNAVRALGGHARRHLDVLGDGSLRLELSLDGSDRVSRTAYVRGAGGGRAERPLSSLSGGQWRRCSLALSLGFGDLVARRGRLRPSLLVLDEPLTHLDSTGRARVGTLLRRLLSRGDPDGDGGGGGGGWSNDSNLSTVLVILQDLAAEELEEAFDQIDTVVKVDGESRVVLDEGAS